MECWWVLITGASDWVKARPASRELRESHPCRKRGKHTVGKSESLKLLFRKPMGFFSMNFSFFRVWKTSGLKKQLSSFLFPKQRWPKLPQQIAQQFPTSSWNIPFQETFRSGWSRPPQVRMLLDFGSSPKIVGGGVGSAPTMKDFLLKGATWPSPTKNEFI